MYIPYSTISTVAQIKQHSLTHTIPVGFLLLCACSPFAGTTPQFVTSQRRATQLAVVRLCPLYQEKLPWVFQLCWLLTDLEAYSGAVCLLRPPWSQDCLSCAPHYSPQLNSKRPRTPPSSVMQSAWPRRTILWELSHRWASGSHPPGRGGSRGRPAVHEHDESDIR